MMILKTILFIVQLILLGWLIYLNVRIGIENKKLDEEIKKMMDDKNRKRGIR